jgi:FKBP-type peptidyl-prolyl cis-trans isomerase
MTAEEVDAFLIGLRAVMLGEAKAPTAPGMSARFETNLKERQAAKAARVKDVEASLLAKLDADKQVKKTDSGLRYQVVKTGDAALKPKASSTVTCLYHGTLTDGTVFDSTRNRNNEPVSFALGEVIPGWTEGLQLVGKGGVIKLWIPANLAYGDQQAGPIPAGSLLTFEIEVLEVK